MGAASGQDICAQTLSLPTGWFGITRGREATMKEADRLQILDDYLLQLRGFVSCFPDNKKAIVLFSGGMDSVVLTGKLIVEQDITVFPVHIVRNQSNLEGENKSIRIFQEVYSKRFKDKFQPVQDLAISFPPNEVKFPMKEYVSIHGYPCRDNMFALYALHYAVSLQSKHGHIFSIFTSAIPGGTYTHDTLIALRSTTILACNSTPFADWNISSPNLDPYLNEHKPVQKRDLVAWGFAHSIPLELTHTCIVSGKVHCGECIFCKKRKRAFAEAGVPDATLYGK